MNRKKVFWGIALLVLGLSFYTYFKSRHEPVLPAPQPSLARLWKTFEGTSPPFNFIFEYPISWKSKETKLPGVLNMAQVLGPRDEVTQTIPAVYVKVRESKGGDSTAHFSETLEKEEARFKSFKKNYEGRLMVAGMKGARLSYQYVLPLPMRSMHPKDTVMRREEVLIEYGGKTYQISFWATEEGFKANPEIFEHLLKTFQFKK